MNYFSIKSPKGSIVYTDTKDHFENAVLRLLSIDYELFSKWLELSENSNENNLLASLSKGFQQLKPLELKYDQHDIFCSVIAENTNYGIVKNSDNIAWLVKINDKNFIRELNPPTYEEQYFEGDKNLAGGYGQYLQQSSWRLEKAKRQIDDIQQITKHYKNSVLDIGSGYGYFRKALDDAGYHHEGIEISSFAASICKKLYNFDTHIGSLSDFKDQLQNKFDIVTLWDVIEHISDYEKFLNDIAFVLKPGGFVVIKTPNIDCPEVKVFGPHYHSFKREHLTYFTNIGLTSCANKFNLHPFHSTSISHLLTGFVGKEKTDLWAKSLKGSDLIVYLRKK